MCDPAPVPSYHTFTGPKGVDLNQDYWNKGKDLGLSEPTWMGGRVGRMYMETMWDYNKQFDPPGWDNKKHGYFIDRNLGLIYKHPDGRVFKATGVD